MIAFEISMGCSGGSRGLLQNSSNKNEIDFSNYPAILACWNSEEVQREFAAWQA